MTKAFHDTEFEPPHAKSATGSLLDDLQLFGHRIPEKPDDRPLPEERAIQAALADVFDALVSTFTETRLEHDLDEVLWSQVNLFHRAGERIARRLDDNEQAQKRSQRDQDGSEIRSVELEQLLAEGGALIDRRDAFETMRDLAAEHFESHTKGPWRPRSGSMANRKALTSAMIDSRDFLAARRRAETEVLIPPGAKVAFTGGYDCQDHHAIWAALDRVHAKHPDMVLLHGGSPKGAEHIASLWAREHKVAQVAFRPDFARHRQAAPFKRNDQMLDVLPIGVIVFPGNGINDNLADKARKLGIPLFDFRKGGGA